MFIVFSLFVHDSIKEAHACSCISPNSPTNELQIHDAVFSGKVVKIDELHPTAPVFSSMDPNIVLFEVDTVWKGLTDEDNIVTVHTAQSSASCGYGFENNREYIVYADTHGDQLQVSLCSRTNTITNATEDLIELGTGFVFDVTNAIISPSSQFESGIVIDEIQCKDSLILVIKYNDTPACVSSVTKQTLIDRDWAKIQNLNEIKENPKSIKHNIIRIEDDGLIALYPENMCAAIDLDRITELDLQRYQNDKNEFDDDKILDITSSDLQQIPNIQELIYAVHSIEFPYNKYSSTYLDGMTFVEYEFFLMEKAMKKIWGFTRRLFYKIRY